MTPVERQITATALRRYAAEQRRRRPHLDEIGEDFAALLEAATASRLANIADRLAAALEAETASESAQLVQLLSWVFNWAVRLSIGSLKPMKLPGANG